MANNAHISFIGTVMQNPTNRQVNNTTVVSLKVAVKTTKKQDNSPWPASDYYDVSVWGKPGENLMSRIKPKTKVWVCGDFMVGEPWKDRDQKEHLSLKVTAFTVEILSGGNYNSNNTLNSNYNNNNNTQPDTSEDEEAPF